MVRILRSIYDTYASLPEWVRQKIDSAIAPPDPEVWVQAPIPALGGKSFLDTFNGPDGEITVASYFADVEKFEHTEQSPAAEPTDLGAALHFDQADLDTNRAGRISPSQRTRLWHRDELQLAGATLCLIGGMAFNIGLLLGWFTARGKGAALGIVLVFLGVILGWSTWVLWADLAGGTVASLEGDLRGATTTGRYGTSYFFEIGGKRFGVPREAWAGVREGRSRAYFLPRSETLLSLEAL